MKHKLYVITPEQLARVERIFVFGDLHGDYFPFTTYLSHIDLSTNLVIFLGDYADRGPYGVETIYAVDNLISRYPQQVLALKGNHEDYLADGTPTFFPCDLMDEVIRKKGDWGRYYTESFLPFIEKLYLAVLLPGDSLFVHGGISSRINGRQDLDRPSALVEKDVLWSDPFETKKSPGKAVELKNDRGLGVLFSQAVTEQLLHRLGLRRIIRSHQPRLARAGLHYNHGRQVITINSTSIYRTRPHVLIIEPAAGFTLRTQPL